MKNFNFDPLTPEEEQELLDSSLFEWSDVEDEANFKLLQAEEEIND